MKPIFALALAGLLAGCSFKGQTIPSFDARMASADWKVLGRTNHEECGTYVFIDWGHLFKNEGAATIATGPAGILTSLLGAGGKEEARALYHALDRVPEATHLLAPRVHTSWNGLKITPVPGLWFGTRCATVEAHGVRIAERPVPNAQ